MLKILVVDDESENVGLLRVVLRRHSIEVVEANNGLDGLILADVEKPDAVILDWMLPDISGEEFCVRLRNNPVIAHLPIIVLSALKDQTAADKALAAGANHYMTKPANFTQLVDQLHRLSVPG